jgi:predicted HicB family RNase H-like nuclease
VSKRAIVQEKKRMKLKRLVVEVSDLFHDEIKKRAVFRGQTMSSWIIMAINERIKEERKRE